MYGRSIASPQLGKINALPSLRSTGSWVPHPFWF